MVVEERMVHGPCHAWRRVVPAVHRKSERYVLVAGRVQVRLVALGSVDPGVHGGGRDRVAPEGRGHDRGDVAEAGVPGVEPQQVEGHVLYPRGGLLPGAGQVVGQREGRDPVEALLRGVVQGGRVAELRAHGAVVAQVDQLPVRGQVVRRVVEQELEREAAVAVLEVVHELRAAEVVAEGAEQALRGPVRHAARRAALPELRTHPRRAEELQEPGRRRGRGRVRRRSQLPHGLDLGAVHALHGREGPAAGRPREAHGEARALRPHGRREQQQQQGQECRRGARNAAAGKGHGLLRRPPRWARRVAELRAGAACGP
mmetsp:Transcript_128422/g.399698  ORF Transcript_128422/g.399698 Transcript_128422/m.399698 type:complete len:315 (+) Transcript_128422:693-1637(+)